MKFKIKPELLHDSNGHPYLGVKVPSSLVEGLVNVWKNSVSGAERASIDALLQKKAERDGDASHITLLTSMEYGRLVKNSGAPSWDKIRNTEVKFEGIGSVEDPKDPSNKAWFSPVSSSEVNAWRQELGLPSKDLHVTLGFHSKDVYFDASGAPADKHTVSFSFPEKTPKPHSADQISKKLRAKHERAQIWEKTIVSACPDPLRRKTVVLDADGVILDWSRRFAEVWERGTGMAPGSLKVVRPEIRNQWERFGVNEKQWPEWRKSFDEGGWNNIPAFDGARAIIDDMKKNNIRVCIVSSVPDSARELRISNLLPLGIDPNDIFLVRSGDSEQKKSDVINRLGASYFFDDDVKNFEGISEKIAGVLVTPENNFNIIWKTMKDEILSPPKVSVSERRSQIP